MQRPLELDSSGVGDRQEAVAIIRRGRPITQFTEEDP
jgi:hypothetical protein